MKTQEIWNTFVDVMFAIEKEVLETYGDKNDKGIQQVLKKPKNKRSNSKYTSVQNAWNNLENFEGKDAADEIINRHIKPYDFIYYDTETELLEIKNENLNYSLIAYGFGISSFIDINAPHRVDGKCKATKPRIKHEDQSQILWRFMQNKVSKEENDKRVEVLRKWEKIVNRYRQDRSFSSSMTSSFIDSEGVSIYITVLKEDITNETLEIAKEVFELIDESALGLPNEYLQAIDLNSNLVTH